MFWKRKKKVQNNTPGNYKDLDRIVYPEGGSMPGPCFAARPQALDIITEYADNTTYCRELRLSLSPSDWCKFETQPFYPQLIEWVRSLENCETQRILDDLERVKRLEEQEGA